MGREWGKCRIPSRSSLSKTVAGAQLPSAFWRGSIALATAQAPSSPILFPADEQAVLAAYHLQSQSRILPLSPRMPTLRPRSHPGDLLGSRRFVRAVPGAQVPSLFCRGSTAFATAMPPSAPMPFSAFMRPPISGTASSTGSLPQHGTQEAGRAWSHHAPPSQSLLSAVAGIQVPSAPTFGSMALARAAAPSAPMELAAAQHHKPISARCVAVSRGRWVAGEDMPPGHCAHGVQVRSRDGGCLLPMSRVSRHVPCVQLPSVFWRGSSAFASATAPLAPIAFTNTQQKGFQRGMDVAALAALFPFR